MSIYGMSKCNFTFLVRLGFHFPYSSLLGVCNIYLNINTQLLQGRRKFSALFVILLVQL